MGWSAKKTLPNEQPPAGIGAVLDQVKQKPGALHQLLRYLPQQHPLYRGKGTNVVKRERGQLFAAFLHTGLPEAALPYVLEVLETEHQAYLVAAAARAVRGLPAPRPQVVPYLLKAITNVKYTDDTVCFDAWVPQTTPPDPTTALLEITQTFGWLGSSALNAVPQLRQFCLDIYLNGKVQLALEQAIQLIEQDNRIVDRSCCEVSFVSRETHSIFGKRNPFIQQSDQIMLEDQERRTITYTDYFQGKPSVVVFFYTRCDNPNKCSLTIARLRELQRKLQTEGLEERIKIAAITYDPFHDDAFRLKAYSEARGLVLNEDNRVFRVQSGMTALLQYFDPGVNYLNSLVNHHTTELFMLNHKGLIISRHRHLQWQLPAVITDLKNQLNVLKRAEESVGALIKNRLIALLSPVLSFIIVFFPKCPFCWAAYLSVFGITNMQFLRFASRSQPLLVALLCVNLLVLYTVAKRRNGFVPFYISLAGMVGVVLGSYFLKQPAIGVLGIVLLLTGALLNSLPHNLYMRLQLGIARLFSVPHFRRRTTL